MASLLLASCPSRVLWLAVQPQWQKKAKSCWYLCRCWWFFPHRTGWLYQHWFLSEREGCPKTCSGPCMTLQRGGHEDVGLQACSAGRGPFLLLVCPKLLHIRNQKDSPSISRSFWQKDVLFPGTRVSSFCARKVFCQQIHPGWKEAAHHWQLPYCEWADAFSLCLMANWNKMDTLYVIIKYMPSWL